MDGRLSRLYEGWKTELIKALAHAEAVIDFVDDENLNPDDDPLGLNVGESKNVGEMAVWGAITPRINALRQQMERHLSCAERG